MRAFFLLVVAISSILSLAYADGTVLRNLPSACDQQTKTCPMCPEGEVSSSCIKINLDMGRTTPWTGSRDVAIKVFTDENSPAIFTPDSVYAVLGYTFKRIGSRLLADRKTPKEVVFSHPNGEPIQFLFNEGEASAVPDPGFHMNMDARLMMVDAGGRETHSEPVYYDLYLGDGSVRRFLATDSTGELGKFVSETDSHGVLHTVEEMGVDVVYNADGIRQLLTPSRLADIRVIEDGFDIAIYPLQNPPQKGAAGLYTLPDCAAEKLLSVRSMVEGRHIEVFLKSGDAEPKRYVFEYARGDWSLIHSTGLKELHDRSIQDSQKARLVYETRSSRDELLKRDEMNFVWESWGFAMTNRIEGFNGAIRTTDWTYYKSGASKGKLRTKLEQSGLLTQYEYDEAGRETSITRSGPDMMTEVTRLDYMPVDPMDRVLPFDARSRSVVKTLDGIECERTYFVYSQLTNIVERVGVQGATYGGTNVLRRVETFYPVVAGDIRSGRIKAVRYEDGKIDLYDYSRETNIWTKIVTHVHEQSSAPMSGKTTRDITLTNIRGESIEQRTEAYIDGAWHAIARERRTYNLHGKVIRSENLAGQVTTSEWDCCHKILETQPDGSMTTWEYDLEGRMVAASRLIPMTLTNVTWVTTCFAYDDLGRQTASWTTNFVERVGLPATKTRYDALGRVVVRTDVLGNDTTMTYSDDGRFALTCNPNTATRITKRNADGDILSIEGTSVTPEFYTYGILTNGTCWTRTVQGETADSPRFAKRYENMLGQTIREERSGFRGAVLATLHTYNDYGRLVHSQPDGEPMVAYEYDNLDSRVATIHSVGDGYLTNTQNEWRRNETENGFALVDSVVWQVQTNIVSCSDTTIAPLVNSQWTQLTGLNSANPLNMRTIDIRGNETQDWTVFSNGVTTAKRRVPEATNIISSRSRYGIELETVSLSAVTNSVIFDALGRTVARNGRGNVNRIEYNKFGQQSATYDGDRNAKRIEDDGFGGFNTTYDRADNPTHYGYDQFGQLIAVTNALGYAIVYEYDLRGRKTFEGGATYPVRYTYDVYGNKITMMTYRDKYNGRDPGDVTTWLYDEASGAMTNKIYADASRVSFDYDSLGRLLFQTNARGDCVGYTYTAWGRLASRTGADESIRVACEYDTIGRLSRVSDVVGVSTFEYDRYGMIKTERRHEFGGDFFISRTRDIYGRPAGISATGGYATIVCYDEMTGLIECLKTSTEGEQISWKYLQGNDSVEKVEFFNGLTQQYVFDQNIYITAITNSSPHEVISAYEYSYDHLNREFYVEAFGAAIPRAIRHWYDYEKCGDVSHFARRHGRGVNTPANAYELGYQFDAAGNRIDEVEDWARYFVNNLNQITYFDAATFGECKILYDADGNITHYKRECTEVPLTMNRRDNRRKVEEVSVSYNALNRPIRWSIGSTNIFVRYDYKGRRRELVKMVEGITNSVEIFVYDGYQCIQRRTARGRDLVVDDFIWDPHKRIGSKPLMWFKTTPRGIVKYAYLFDANRNVSEVLRLVDYSIAAHYEYTPYGELIECSGDESLTNPWRFSSEYADDTRTIYFCYRQYLPLLGRWMSRDPMGESARGSLYIPVDNDLINNNDGLSIEGPIEYN